MSFPVIKPLVTQGTARYRMRGMDIIFPMPLDFFGSSGLDSKASQSQAFFKKGQLLLFRGNGDKKG